MARSDYLKWEEYFMSIAVLTARRSKDPVTQVGCCIVNNENKIVAIGYNGMPIGCSDADIPWTKTSKNWLENKYPYVCHAEMNAILNKNSACVKDCTLYVCLFPCNECAKMIIQTGIKAVVYLEDKYPDREWVIASKKLLDMAGIVYSKYQSIGEAKAKPPLPEYVRSLVPDLPIILSPAARRTSSAPIFDASILFGCFLLLLFNFIFSALNFFLHFYR